MSIFKTIKIKFSETTDELKKVSWPTKKQLFQWSLGVIAFLIVFGIIVYVFDSFAVVPVMTLLSGLFDETTLNALNIALTVIFVLSGLLLMISIFMRSSEDGGLSDFVSSNISGSTQFVERNLSKMTIILGIVFFVSAILLMMLFPHGTIGMQ